MEPEDSDNLLLRLVHPSGKITKLKAQKPETMDAFLSLIQKEVGEPVSSDQVYYIDNDFKEEFSLTNVAELKDKMSINIKKITAEVEPTTEIPSTSTTSTEVSSSSASAKLQWPVLFPIPNFDVDVETEVAKRNNHEVNVPLSKATKGNILKSVCQAIYKYKTYPSDKDFQQVAEQLIKTHPGLKEAGSPLGYECWATCIKYAMVRLP